METGFAAFITAASDALTSLGVMPLVIAGGVIALVGGLIRAGKKVGR